MMCAQIAADVLAVSCYCDDGFRPRLCENAVETAKTVATEKRRVIGMYCEACGVENLETVTRCLRCGRDFLSRQGGPNFLPPAPRKWLRPSKVLLFVFVWTLLVVQIVSYAGRLPETPLGWAALVGLGPVAYVLLAAMVDAAFSAKK
jgi:hypothetical protein